jgi:hypothetical protein
VKTFLKTILVVTYLCGIKSVAAQDEKSIFPQKGVELCWSKTTIVFYNKHIKDDKQIETKVVAFDIGSGESITFPHGARIISALAFDELIVTVALDGEIKGFSKTGLPIELLSYKSPGEGYLSACKLSDEGIFVVLSLLPLDDKSTKNYQLDFIKISDAKSYIFKRIIPNTPIGYGNLVFRQERLWLLEKNRATQIDIPKM